MRTLLAICMVTLLSISINNIASAQNEEADRDIRIAESILDEIFSDVSETNLGFPFRDERSVKGEYIPGVGLHFSVGENYFSRVADMSGSIRIKENDGPEQSISFDRKDTGERLEEQEIEERLQEYLTGYASQLRSVKDEEELRITFGLNTNTNRWVSVFQSSESDSMAESNRAVSKWVSGRDLRRVREGDMASPALLQQIETVTIPLDDQPRDIEIFSSILETAVRDIEMEGLRVNRTVKSNYIPGWGVRYYISTNSSGGGMFRFMSEADQDEIQTEIDTALTFDFDSDSLDFNMEEFETNNEDVKGLPDSLDISSSLSEAMDSLAVALPKIMDSLKTAMPKMMEGIKTMFASEEVPADEVLIADMELLDHEIRDIVENYGSTLSTLKEDELLTISVNWRGRSSTLPEKRVYYIPKRNLLNRGELKVMEM
jgi:hypothetical protein